MTIAVGDTVRWTAEANARSPGDLDGSLGLVAALRPEGTVGVRWLSGSGLTRWVYATWLERAPDFLNPYTDLAHWETPPAVHVFADWLIEQGHLRAAHMLRYRPRHRAKRLAVLAKHGGMCAALAAVCGWSPSQVFVGVDYGAEPKTAVAFTIRVDLEDFKRDLQEAMAAEAERIRRLAESMYPGEVREEPVVLNGTTTHTVRMMRTGNALGKSSAFFEDIMASLGPSPEQPPPPRKTPPRSRAWWRNR